MFLLCTAPPRVFDISSVDKLALCVFTHQNQYPYTPSYIHVYVVCMFFKLLYTQWPIYVGGVWVQLVSQPNKMHIDFDDEQTRNHFSIYLVNRELTP